VQPHLRNADGVPVGGDYDLTDPTELRGVVSEVETFLGAKSSLRLSFLTGEEWLDTLNRSLSPALRRGAERHLHMLVDRRDPHHLVFSPSAVAGINERDARIYAEVVHHVLWRIPSELEPTLRRGVDSLIAEWLGGRLGVEIYTQHAPAEKELVELLLACVSVQYGHDLAQWALLLRRNPDRFFQALEKSSFIRVWMQKARLDKAIVDVLAGADNRRQALIALLRASEGISIHELTRAAAVEYLDQVAAERAQTAKAGKDKI
jgi:hypothetical protein